MADLGAAVEAALIGIHNPRVNANLIEANMVRDLVVAGDGSVSFTFLLEQKDPASLVRQAKHAVRAVTGVKAVAVNVVDPAVEAASPRSGPQPSQPPPPPGPTPQDNLGKVIAVSSGKGGVGKSTVTVNLAVALAARGHQVGLMDADVYGPDIPLMLGQNRKPEVQGGKIVPLGVHGVKVMSLGLLIERDVAAIWRGPIIMKVVQQFLRDVMWGDLEYFLVDMPPGTGDAQLSLVQSIQVDGAVIVTTPQDVAAGDSLRGAKMFERVGVPVIGVVENMSGFVCPHCGKTSEVFRSGGGARLAEELSVPLLGSIPLQDGMTSLADNGEPVVLAQPSSPAAKALAQMATQFIDKVGKKPVRLPIVTH